MVGGNPRAGTDAYALMVVVTTCEDSPILQACLESLNAACEASNGRVLLVANNCELSVDSTEALSLCKGEILCLKRRLGYAAANNPGLRLAIEQEIPFVMLLNPDTVVHPLALKKLRDFLLEHPAYWAVGSFQVDYSAESWDQPNHWTRQFLEERLGRARTTNLPEVIPSDYVQGAAMLIRTKRLEVVGLLEERLGSFYEETELCRRMRLSGGRIGIVAHSRVRHLGGGYWRRTWFSNLRRDFFYFRNEFLFRLSGAIGLRCLAAEAWGTARGQLRRLRTGSDRTVMRPAIWPIVVFGVLCKVDCLVSMWLRTRRFRKMG